MPLDNSQGERGATQRPVSPSEIGRGRGLFQIIWKNDAGELIVHQLQGDVRSLVDPRNPDGKRLRDSIFWHLKATFFSTAAAEFGLPPVEIEPDPSAQNSAIVTADGKPYNALDGGRGNGDGGGTQSH